MSPYTSYKLTAPQTQRVCVCACVFGGVGGVEQYNGGKQWRSYGEGVRGVESFILISEGSHGILSW